MAKTWVLDTETKGTGANMVPLEKAREERRDAEYWNRRRSALRRAGERPGAAEPPAPRDPYRFRIVDVMTRQVLVEDVDARAAVAALEGVRSVVDVLVDVWDPAAGDWRRLPLDDVKKLWRFRRAAASGVAPQGSREGPTAR